MRSIGEATRVIGKKHGKNRWILSKTVLGFVKGFVRVKETR
jgi:hypothetical protein